MSKYLIFCGLLMTLIVAIGACGKKMGGNYPNIFEAARAGDTEAVAKFLAEGAKPTDKDENGMTVLHHAAESGNTDLASRLLASGAKANEKDNQGRTPLQLALKKGDKSMARLLDEFGAEE